MYSFSRSDEVLADEKEGRRGTLVYTFSTELQEDCVALDDLDRTVDQTQKEGCDIYENIVSGT